jgi:hypothetical protein
MLALYLGDTSSNLDDLMRVMVKDVIWKQDCSRSLLVYPANHYYTVALYSFITAP